MSELDGQSPMNREQFKRKYIDSHTEIQAMSKLGKKKGWCAKNNDIIEPSDKNAANVKHLKKPIERKCAIVRAENVTHFVYDAIEVRAEDVLDKEQVPMKDLLKIAVSAAPKHVKIDANINNTFADLWNTTDIEGKADYDD
jgi:hypothetical protein